MPRPRLAPASLAALLLACGPESPDSAVTDSTGAASGTGSPETTTTTATTTTTTTGGAVTTSGVDPLTGTGAPPDPTMSEETTGTTAPGPCVADPASGTCTDSCDHWLDCCKCNGQEFFPDPMASDCTLAMGIVTAACPWSVWDLRWDGEWVPEVAPDQCAVTESGWYQEGLDGDLIIRLCGQACTDYLAGEFTMIKGDMFCEVA